MHTLRSLLSLTVMTALALAGSGCDGFSGNETPGAPKPKGPVPTGPVAPQALEAAVASNAFGLALADRLRAAKPDANLFLSPTSLHQALTMARLGAKGATLAELDLLLGYAKMVPERVAGANEALRRELDGIAHARLAVANSVWRDLAVSVEPAYEALVRRTFDAELMAAPFAEPATVGAVNGWVSKHTEGKIPTIVGEIPAAVRMLLVNAIYFKGAWKAAFKPARTVDADFHAAGGATVKVSMMTTNDEVHGYLGEGYRAAKLPYQGDELAMVVLLPDADQDLARLVTKLLGVSLGALPFVHDRRGSVSIPRFKIEWNAELVPVLRDMGLALAVSDRADFSAMTPSERLKIGAVLHKSVVEVNEEGTEAAAATVVMMTASRAAVDPSEPFRLYADRPFLFAITHTRTGAVLFLGALNRP